MLAEAMTFEKFKSEVLARWPSKKWYFVEPIKHSCYFQCYCHPLHVEFNLMSERWNIGIDTAHGAQLDSVVKHTRNILNRAYNALRKERSSERG